MKRNCVSREAGPGIDTLQPGGSSKMLIVGSVKDLSFKGDGPMSHRIIRLRGMVGRCG